MLLPDPIIEHLDSAQRLALMRLDHRLPGTNRVPLLLRFCASLPFNVTHWDRLSLMRTCAANRTREAV
jgi:hypothetical protein